MSSREQFEAWACKQWPYLAQEIRYRRDALPADDPRYMNYVSYDLQAAWEAWQGARGSIEIELPEAKDAGRDIFGQMQSWELTGEQYKLVCIEAIEAAGLQVKL